VAEDDTSPQVQAHIERRVARDLGYTVRAWSRLTGGRQNRLYRLEIVDGPPLLAKHYVVDRWPRLESEFATLRALNQHRFARVPRALLRDDQQSYAVYSFEPGEVRPAAQLIRDDAEQIAAFATDLQRFAPRNLQAELFLAVDASLSLAGQREVIRRRLADIETYAEAERLRGVRARIDELLSGLVDDAQPPLAPDAWRLTTGDFGPQNMLFAADGALTVVDFEAAGWDDPARVVMGFVAHAASEDLPPDVAQAFLSAYARLRRLSQAEQTRYELVGRLLDVEWVAIYASALSGENIANKRAAVQGFSRQAYVDEVLQKLQRRLARAEAGQGYPFPR
jgi:aminoglycoside phosphotransferase (APT) family kinase protein